MHITPMDVRRSIFDAPKRRLLAELYCLYLTFVFHEQNSDLRKLATLVLVGVWASIEVGAAFGVATLPDQFFFLRLVIGVLIGRLWGIEINNFAGVTFDYEPLEDSDE